jgi:ABC-type transport system substrate-binding protein
MTRIDRRALFTSGAAAALLAATGVSLDAAPRPGGRLRLAVPRDGSLWAVARGAVFGTLTEIAPDGVLRGELAAGWYSGPEARDWRFDLAQGAVFHDGRPVTAADVAASLIAHDPVALRGARITAADARTLRIDLAAGDPQLPLRLADPALFVAPGGDVARPLSQAMGSGMYQVLRADPDRHFLARRVQGHVRDGRAGWVDSIEIVVIPDAAVRAEALRGGHVDVAALPARDGLIGRDGFVYHPSADDMALAARHGVGVPRRIGSRTALDDGRIAERWWMG